MTGFNTDGIHLRKNGGVIPTPPTDKVIIYLDGTGVLKAKDENGTVISVGIDLTNEVAVISGGVDTNAAAIIVNASDIADLTSDVAVVSGGVVINAADILALQGDYVSLTATQTISGDKTFESAVTGVDPTLDSHFATKSYVDTAVVSAGGGATDHGALTGLGDDDHTQYILVDGTRAFTGTVAGVTPSASADLATKAYVDDSLILIDHGGLDGLGDDDHTQYLRHDGGRQISGTIITDTSGAYDLGSLARPFREIYASDGYYIGSDTLTTSAGTLLVNGSPVQGGGGVTDHGALTGLSDDDHAQYFLADGSREVSGSIIPSTSGDLDLGSAAKPFRDLYVTENSLHLGPNTISTSASKLLFNGAELTVNSASQVIATVIVKDGETIGVGMGVSVDPTSAGTAVEGLQNITSREPRTAHIAGATPDYRELRYHPAEIAIEFEAEDYKAWMFYYNGSTYTRADTGTWTASGSSLHQDSFSTAINEDGSKVIIVYVMNFSSNWDVYYRIGTVDSDLKTIAWGSETRLDDVTSGAVSYDGSPSVDIFPGTNYCLINYGSDEGATVSMNSVVVDLDTGAAGTILTHGSISTIQQPRGAATCGLTSTRAFGYLRTVAESSGDDNHYYLLTRSGLGISETTEFHNGTDFVFSPTPAKRIQAAQVGTATIVVGGTDNFETTEGYKYFVITISGDTFSFGTVKDYWVMDDDGPSFFLNKKFGDRSSVDFVIPVLDKDGVTTLPYITTAKLQGGSLIIQNVIDLEDTPESVSSQGFNSIEISDGVYANVWDDGATESFYNAVSTTAQTKWLGLSLESKTGGQSIKVLLKGIYETSGLDIVSQYYFDFNGNLTTVNESQPVGFSIDTNKLYVDMLGGYDSLEATFSTENNSVLSGHLSDSSIHFSLDTNADLGTSDSVAPSQNAVKSYVDAATSGGGVTDHGSLTGLGDDDHTQYLLADGSREISGSLVPSTSGTLSLGTSGQPFKDLYVLENSIYMGTNKLSISGGVLQLNDSNVDNGGGEPISETKTASFTAQVGYRYNLNGSSNFTATLPTAVGNLDEEIEFVTYVGNTAVCTLDCNGSQHINGVGGETYDMTFGDRLVIKSDGANWIIKDKVGTVNVYADSNAGQVLSISTTDIQYEDNISDPYGAWSGNDTFTAPRSGYYNVNATIGTESSVASYSLQIFVNGSSFAWGPVSDNSSFSRVVPIDKTVYLDAGDTLTIRPGMSVTRDTNSIFNQLFITEVS